VLADAAPANEIDHGPCLVGDPQMEAVDVHPLNADLQVAQLTRAARADIDVHRAGPDPPALRDEDVDGMRDVVRQAVDRARRGSPEHAAADLAGDRVVQPAVEILSALHVEVPGEADDLPLATKMATTRVPIPTASIPSRVRRASRANSSDRAAGSMHVPRSDFGRTFVALDPENHRQRVFAPAAE
jgi:hypothetical protein